MYITNDIRYVGVNDHNIDLFEGQYPVPNGMAYNSYVILDEKVAVMDTADANFTGEWLANVAAVLDGRQPDYLIVQHMEPDHSASIAEFLKVYPEVTVVGNARTFPMLNLYFPLNPIKNQLTVKEGDVLELGRHQLTFVLAPMVHWPEVMLTYDSADKVLFSADAFGKFGALDAEEPWEDEARRYYIGIVGKYGAQVQALLKKAAGLDIEQICSLHGPVLNKNLAHYVGLYDTWSAYRPEEEGVVIAYTSVYGHTREGAEKLFALLQERGVKAEIYDLARDDQFAAVAAVFRYDRVVLATTTYNGDIFPFMKEFIHHLTERGFKNRTVGLMENGSWAPQAARIMGKMLEACKDLTLLEPTVRINAALNADSEAQIAALADALCK